MSRGSIFLLVTGAAIVVGAAAYAAGISAGRAQEAGALPQRVVAQAALTQDPFQPPPGFEKQLQVPQQFQIPPAQGPMPFPGQQPFQMPNQSGPGSAPPLREFIPLPGPGDQQPGQRPGQQQGDCQPIILFYHNGQLYQLQPGPGQENGPGRPGTPPEFFPLNPYQGPAIPGLPLPPERGPGRGPGFAPVNPRS
jgi:hypothetical protein